MSPRSSATAWSRATLFSATLLPLALFADIASAADPADLEYLLENGSCSACDLTAAEIPALASESADLSFSDLTGADMYRAYLPSADLTGANMSGVDIKRSNLNGVSFIGADLSGADLSGADLTDADLSGVVTDAGTLTDETTICSDGSAGPCPF